MRENEFEKRVQQQMEEFKLRPSDAVWEKVEEELRKKKKRRVVFFIFLLAGLSLLGYTGYFISNQSTQNIAEQNFTQPSKNSDKENRSRENTPSIQSSNSNESASINQDQLTIKPNPVDGSHANEEPGNTQDNNLENSRVNQQEIAGGIEPVSSGKAKPVFEKAIDHKNINNKKAANSFKKRKKELAEEETTVAWNDINEQEKPNTNEEVVAQNNLEKEEPVAEKQPVADSLTKDAALAKIEEKETKPGDAKPTQKINSKIRWGFDLAVGLSGIKDNAFLFSNFFSNRQKSIMDRAYSSPGNSGSGSIYTPPISPSSIKAGPAFKLGVVAQKEITKRSSVSAGLQYAYLNTKMKVGSYRDTSVVLSNAVSQSLRLDAVYRAAPQKDYTNHYHLLQLPVQYHLQLNKGKKLPLLWNVGASLGYLVNTNALVYDTTAGGIYYRDNDIFNRWQVNLNTGFSFVFGKSEKIQWSVGPEISLGMNKLMKDTYSNKQYLLYGGLSGRIIFPRKK